MVRWIVLAMLVYLSVELIGRLAAFAGIVLDPVSLGVGSVMTMLILYVWFRLDSWWEIFGRQYRPQVVTLKTEKTPSRITLAALGALVKWIIVTGVLVGLSAYFILNQ